MQCFALTIFFSFLALLARAEHRASIGSGLVIEDLEIEGAELKVIPRIDTKIPIILRIIKSEATENGYRYDLYVEGLDEGNYNLATYLSRTDGSNSSIPEIPFEAYSILQDKWTEPQALEKVKPEAIGGYRKLMWVLCLLWILGLVAILLIRKTQSIPTQAIIDPSLSERIHKLLKQSNNNLTVEQKAELDRMIIGHWRHQFPDLEHLPVANSIAFLKDQPDSAPMLISVEKWLHSGQEISTQEIDEALSDYQISKKEDSTS